MNGHENHKNIVLIGMSGVGKTTIAKYIAEKLNMKYLDTDDMIISNSGKTIDSIFSIYGEKYFRALERKAIESLSQKKGVVISTGGGVILDNYNIQVLKKNGIIFLLKASIGTLISNIESSPYNKENRPLLKNSSCLREKIEDIYKDREKLYLSSANEIINVDNKTTDKIGDEIIYIFKQLSTCSYF